MLFCFDTNIFHNCWGFNCILMKNFICFPWLSLKLSPSCNIVITFKKFYYFWKVKGIKLPLPKGKMRFLTLSVEFSLMLSVALSRSIFSVLNVDMENWNNGHYCSHQSLYSELCLKDASYSICQLSLPGQLSLSLCWILITNSNSWQFFSFFLSFSF